MSNQSQRTPFNVLAFLHVMWRENVSCPPSNERHDRDREVMLAGYFNTDVFAAVASSLLNTPIDLFFNGGPLKGLCHGSPVHFV